jgi:hypothetical protein
MAGDRELKAMEATLAALQPLDGEERQRVLDWLVAKLGLEAPAPSGLASSDLAGDGGAVGVAGNLGTIKQFLNQKKPGDDVARATALAYFLTHGKDQATYKTADLSKARVDAALANFNMSRAVSNAQRAGYLTTAGKRGTYQVTGTGEALVEAMPDADAVKKVKEQGGRRRRKSAGTRRAPKGTARKR